MKNADWKKQQKNVSKCIREMNEDIYNDELWLGRFYIHQIDSHYERFSDGSGGILRICVRMWDRKTGYHKDVILDNSYEPRFFRVDLFEAVNDFIINDCKAWENEDPYKNIVDFRKECKYAE